MWNTVLLKDIMPDVFTAATEALNATQTALDKLAEASSATTAKLADAQALVTAIQTQLNELDQTGFATIVLTPKQGSWIDLLLNAEDAPVNNNSMYSCGYINITVAATEADALSAYDTLSKALSDDFKRIEMNPSLPEEPSFLTIPEFELPIDKWEGITLGEMFPGLFKTVKDSFNAASQALKQIENTSKQIQAKIEKLETAKNKAQNLINGLSLTGQYQLKLTPALGGWMTRAQSEAGAPSSSTMYVTGYAAIAVSADMTEVADYYNRLSAVM